MLKKILVILSFLGIASVAHAATVFNSNQVGTNPSNGLFLQTNGATSTWASGTPTTTINGVQGPTFTFSVVSTSSASSVTTSTAQLFLNLFSLSSSSDITISQTGTLVFASRNISQFTNNSNYITLLSLSASSPLSYSTSTGAFSCPTCITTTQATTTIAVGNTTFTGPNFVASSSGIVSLSTSTPNTFIYGLSTSTLNTNVAALGYVTSTASVSGSDTQIQFNNNGNFGATSTFTVASGTGQVNFPGNLISGGKIPTVMGASNNTQTIFNFTGATSSFTVPTNVTSLLINTRGGGPNGLGGSVTGTIAVAPGQTFYVFVASTTGGALGGQGSFPGGTGGGKSWVSTSSAYSTGTVLMVAGGGGGFGGANIPGGGSLASGGFGGGLTAGTGGIGSNGGSNGGTGGSQTTPGTGGTGSANNGQNATPTTPGQGGANTFNSGSGGGGGDGYFPGGGGGGAAAANNVGGGGGGGGSSFIALNTFTSTSTATSSNNGAGVITFTYLAFPTIQGTNIAGKITAVASMTTSTITFSQSFPNPPSCSITPNQSGQTQPPYVSSTASSILVTLNNALTNAQSFNYLCVGY